MLYGLGSGMQMPLTAAVLNGMPAGRPGMASGVLNAFKQVFGLLGITTLGPVSSRRVIVSRQRSPRHCCITKRVTLISMGTLNVRTDDAMETALRALAGDRRSRSEAVRYAILRTYKEMLLEQAEADADRLRNDPDDQAEMLAIQRFMGVAE
jgi:Arc/MetJ-type ribon-helix-helix transcriptional regulator